MDVNGWKLMDMAINGMALLQFLGFGKKGYGKWHRLPLHLLIVSLGQKSGRPLQKRLGKIGCNFKTQFTHVPSHF